MTDQPIPWENQGCQVCRDEWMAGRHPRRLAVSAALHETLYRCDRCRTFWIETERYAAAVDAERALSDFGHDVQGADGTPLHDVAATLGLGCRVCREGVYSGGQPRFVVAPSGSDLLYRCDACGAWWVGNERAAWPVSREEAEAGFPEHVGGPVVPPSVELSRGVSAYVWGAGGAVPGRHPDLVADAALRAQVEDVIAAVDRIRPDAGAADLTSWASSEVRAIATRFPGLDDRALRALHDLLTWTWR